MINDVLGKLKLGLVIIVILEYFFCVLYLGL